MELYKLVKELAIKKKMSHSKLAKHSGVAKSTITRYMNGKTDLASEALARILVVLGFDIYKHVVTWLLWEDEKIIFRRDKRAINGSKNYATFKKAVGAPGPSPNQVKKP
jgi:transcriptional regulator with XRE-family HTH domain